MTDRERQHESKGMRRAAVILREEADWIRAQGWLMSPHMARRLDSLARRIELQAGTMRPEIPTGA